MTDELITGQYQRIRVGSRGNETYLSLSSMFITEQLKVVKNPLVILLSRNNSC